MGHKTRKKAEIEHRRMRVSELYLKGWSQTAIAHELGVSQGTISGDIKALRKEWRENRLDNMDEVVLEGQRRYQQITREAWNGWEASQQPVEITRITQKNNIKKIKKTVRQQPGDSRFLKIILETEQKRAELLGLNADHQQLSAEEQRKQDRLNWEILFEDAKARAKNQNTDEQLIAEHMQARLEKETSNSSKDSGADGLI